MCRKAASVAFGRGRDGKLLRIGMSTNAVGLQPPRRRRRSRTAKTAPTRRATGKKPARHSTDLEQMYRPHFHPSKMYTLVHYLMYLILWYIICQVLYLAPPAVPTSPPSSAQTSIVTSTALGTPLVGKRPDCAQRRCDASASARRHRREHRSGPESGTSPRPRAAARGPDTASGRNCAPCEATCRALPKPL